MGFKESIYNIRVRIDGQCYIYNTLFRSVYKALHADHETGAADNK